MVWLLALQLGTSWGQSEPLTASESGQLERINSIVMPDGAPAREALVQWHTSLGKLPAYAVERIYLEALARLQAETGRRPESRKTATALKELALAHNDVNTQALAAILESTSLLEPGRAPEALAAINKTESVVQKSGDLRLQRRFHSALSAGYFSLGKYEPAMEHALAALDIARREEPRSKFAVATELNGLAAIQLGMRKPAKALQTLDDALAIANALGARSLQAKLLVNRAYALSELGKEDQAYETKILALRLSRETGLANIEATTLTNLADAHLEAHQYAQAAEFARQAIVKSQEIGNLATLATAQANLGFALIGQSRLSEGKSYVQQALKTHHDTGALADEVAILSDYSRSLQQAGKTTEALQILREQLRISEELFQKDRASTIAIMEEKFEAAQRQRQIALLEQENTLKDAALRAQHYLQLFIVTASLAVVTGATGLYVLYRRSRASNTKLKLANARLEFHSIHDQLTGLYNRRFFLDRMQRRATDTERLRHSDSPSDMECLMMLDIDHFKHVNDTWGHACGDAVLVEVAARIQETLRDTDLAMRWGGEEFLVFCGKAPRGQMDVLAKRLLQAVGVEPVVFEDQSVAVTVSIGFVHLPMFEPGSISVDWKKALAFADKALYISKQEGRNLAIGLGRLLQAPESALEKMETDLAHAFAAGVVEKITVRGPGKDAASKEDVPSIT